MFGGMETEVCQKNLIPPTKKLYLSIFTPDLGVSRWEMEGQMWALDLCGGKPSSPHSQLPLKPGLHLVEGKENRLLSDLGVNKQVPEPAPGEGSAVPLLQYAEPHPPAWLSSGLNKHSVHHSADMKSK